MLTPTQLTAASTGNWLFQFLRQWSSAAGISLVLAGLPLCSLLVHSPPALSAKILPESFIWCHFLSHFPFPHSFSYDVLISSYSLMVLSGRLWEGAEIKCVQSATPHWGHDRSPIHQTDTSIAISGDHVVSPSRNGSSQRTYGHICFFGCRNAQWGGMLLATIGWRTGRLPNTLQCWGQPLPQGTIWANCQ